MRTIRKISVIILRLVEFVAIIVALMGVVADFDVYCSKKELLNFLAWMGIKIGMMFIPALIAWICSKTAQKVGKPIGWDLKGYLN